MAGRSAQEVACFVFQKHYRDLSSGLLVHLPMIASNLWSEELISVDIKDKVLDNGTSQPEKCMCLLKDVEDRIKRDSSVFEKFCGVLCSQEVGLSHLGDPMLRKFQELFPKPIIQGSYNTLSETLSRFSGPASESQIDITEEGMSNMQPSRSDKYSTGDGDGDGDGSGERAASIPAPFKATQQPLETDGDLYVEQVVPEKESGRPERAKTVAPYVGLFDTDRFGVGYSIQGRDSEEERLVSDLVLSWDRVKLKCENCARIQAKYEKKLEDVKEFYDKRLKSNVTKSASFRQLKEDKQHLLRTIQIQSMQSEEDRRKLEENEMKIEELEFLVEKQMSELMETQLLLESKKKEQEKLKSTLGSKERELHEIAQLAKNCPVYSNKKRQAHFARKKELCEEIQSLVAKFFAACTLDDKSKLHDEIQSKFVHFTSLKRRRSFSL